MVCAGCVSYLFDRKAVFAVDALGMDDDNLLGIALDAGADDMKREGDNFIIYADPGSFSKVQEALQKAGVQTTSSEITQIPKVAMDVDLETAQKVVRLVEALDDHDDVQNVYSSLNFTEELAAAVGKE
jgi:transcriptional/translational regulatory protein YebC/TACO1